MVTTQQQKIHYQNYPQTSSSTLSIPRSFSSFHITYHSPILSKAFSVTYFPSKKIKIKSRHTLRYFRLKMALQFHNVFRPNAPAKSPSLVRSPALLPAKYSTVSGDVHRSTKMIGSKRSKVAVTVRSSFETSGGAAAAAVVVVGQVTEVDKDTFWPIVNAAGDKPVVLDMYTQWCGPCKVMAPKFQGLAEKYLDVVFLKLDCNEENKPLAKELGIKVVPTFKILKHGKIQKEVTGAKFDNLVAAMEEARST